MRNKLIIFFALLISVTSVALAQETKNKNQQYGRKIAL